MPRRPNGTFAPGPMPQDLKDAISAGQIARHERAEQQAIAQPTLKRCSQCRRMKRIDEFPQRTRKLASGKTKKYPAGECLKCNAARSAAHREKLRAEGTYAESIKRWNAARDPEHRKSYQREYGAIRRRQQGAAPRGPWKRYRENGRPGTLDPQPLLNYLGPMDAHELNRIADSAGVLRQLNGMRAGTHKLTLHVADALLMAMGAPELLPILYPYESTPSTPAGP